MGVSGCVVRETIEDPFVDGTAEVLQISVIDLKIGVKHTGAVVVLDEDGVLEVGGAQSESKSQSFEGCRAVMELVVIHPEQAKTNVKMRGLLG